MRGRDRNEGCSTGDYRHRIVIKAPPDPNVPSNKNGFGEVVGDWIEVLTLWASKEPLLGNEYFRAESIQSEVEVKFRARYRPGVENTMRVYQGDEAYEILSAINVKSLNRELLIYCKKVE